ncbi:putative ankyrin repeat protein [Tolypocladium ophioglossoides CBS 100239]|uniref:Putative ankyrin repeat protein n=1 Tax=Tolypocladium ophioglossoides (strain CBS 100239) TaxID=1163406 RepID=A0A0L0MWT6_TOLOC|nr:putative ankyrin repeat protein [Tolypocladium ophioglossoides CBS 100239]
MSLKFHFNHDKIPQPPRQTPDEVIDQFKAAVSANDLDAFHKLLRLHLASGPNGRFNIHDLYLVMYEAVRQDHATVVVELLRHGMGMRYTFALEAILTRAKDSLCVFIQNGWDVSTPISETEPTVFAYAVADREMALWLLSHGADLNKQTYIDLTPMSYAIQFAPPDLVEELLNRGGDVQRGELLQHALDRPADTVEVLGMLLDRGALLNATMYENHDASRRLYPFMEFGTPLHKAAAMGRADVVRYLLGWKADATVRDAKGRTAMDCADRAGYDEVVGILKSVSGE